MVTKGWLRASEGAILFSASISNMVFSRPTYSLRSAFSANESLPFMFSTRFTWGGRTKSTSSYSIKIHWCSLVTLQCHMIVFKNHLLVCNFVLCLNVSHRLKFCTHICHVIQTAKDVLPGLFGFHPSLSLMLLCRLQKQKMWGVFNCEHAFSRILPSVLRTGSVDGLWLGSATGGSVFGSWVIYFLQTQKNAKIKSPVQQKNELFRKCVQVFPQIK